MKKKEKVNIEDMAIKAITILFFPLIFFIIYAMLTGFCVASVIGIFSTEGLLMVIVLLTLVKGVFFD